MKGMPLIPVIGCTVCTYFGTGSFSLAAAAFFALMAVDLGRF